MTEKPLDIGVEGGLQRQIADLDALLGKYMRAGKELQAEVERLRVGLEEIVAMSNQTIFGPSRQDYIDRQIIDERRAHELGAHKAFRQCADMALTLLGRR